ncbi:MAG TPA: STAS domain-containing protein [Bryobacterales bacterium]|jgi:anti-sigma B factor antagonist|nr:STAS domain-containing protein [Bryobacterales bacterium]
MPTTPRGSNPGLTLETCADKDATVVHCAGKLTAASTSIFHERVKGLFPTAKRVVLDLTDIAQMDSMGLGTIVGLYVSAKASGCELELINLSKQVRRLLSLTNLLSLFEPCGQHMTRIP